MTEKEWAHIKIIDKLWMTNDVHNCSPAVSTTKHYKLESKVMIINIRQHIHLVMEEIGNFINSFTYPVFIRAKNDRPDLIASSVVIKIESKIYLITASHVLDNYLNSYFYIGIEGSIVGLSGNFIHTTKGSKNRDDFDIAFINLDKKFVASNNINVLDEDKLIINNRQFKSNYLPLIHGYP